MEQPLQLTKTLTSNIFLINFDRQITKSNKNKTQKHQRNRPTERVSKVFTRNIRDVSNQENSAHQQDSPTPEVDG